MAYFKKRALGRRCYYNTNMLEANVVLRGQTLLYMLSRVSIAL